MIIYGQKKSCMSVYIYEKIPWGGFYSKCFGSDNKTKECYVFGICVQSSSSLAFEHLPYIYVVSKTTSEMIYDA